MQFDSPSRGTSSQVLGTHAGGYPGTVILADGSSSGRVFVPGAVLTRIASRAAMRAAMGSAAERGGLLIGPKPGSTDLIVDEALPVPAEYVFTPSLVGTFGTFDTVKKAIAAAQQDDAKSVLGVYRIRPASNQPLLRTEFEILDGIRESHPALSNIRTCLVIEAAVGHDLPMRVLIRTGGGWEERQQIGLNLGPYPAANEREAAESDPLSFPARTPSPDPPPLAVAPPTWKPGAPYAALPATGGWMRTAIVLAAAGLLLAGAASAYRWIDLRRSPAAETRRETPPAIRTGFSANPEGSSWKLTWNSAAVLATNPTGANLLIRDGADEQDIPLTISDLSSGTMYYSPKSGDLTFRLQLRRDGDSVAEDQVRVIDRITTIGQNSQGRQFPSAGNDAFTGSQRTVSRTPEQATSSSDDSAPPGLREIANNVRPFVPPTSRSPRPSESNPILAADAPLQNAGFDIPPSVLTSFEAPPPPSQPPAAAPVTPPDPVSSPPPQAGAPNSPSVSTAAPNNFQAPRPIRQVQPLPPSDTRTTGAAQVTVLVSIDANGRVTKVTPVGHADFGLTTAATKAALLWQFEPGRLNGKAVPSQMNLVFRFRRS